DGLKGTSCRHQQPVGDKVRQKVAAHARAAVYTDRSAILLRIEPRQLQRLVCALQEQPLLRIGELSLPGAKAKEPCVEQLSLLQHGPCFTVVGILEDLRIDSRRFQFLVAEA